MVSLVRRVLAPHLQDTERVAVVGRGRNKKMVVAQHLRKKRYRVFLEEPELHESMSWSTFHSIMKRLPSREEPHEADGHLRALQAFGASLAPSSSEGLGQAQA